MFNKTYSSDELLEDVQAYDPRESSDFTKLPIKFSIDELDQFCLYMLSTNSKDITHSAMMNIKVMFEMLDRRTYRTNDSAKARLEFIDLAIEARIDLGLTSRTLIKNHIIRNCDTRLKDIIEQEIMKPLSGQRISNETCMYINTVVFENLLNGWSLACSKELSSLLSKKESGEIKKISDFAEDLKKLIRKIDSDIRKSEEYKRDGKGFDLTSQNVSSLVSDVMTEFRSPSNKLRTGIQYLNKMLNGGFEGGRSYLFMGVTGVGKSVILLTCALWIIKYNTLPPIDGKKQAVLFISQENSKSETFERIFNMNVSGEDIRNFSDEQIVDGLRNAGLLDDINNKESMSFIFKYYSDKEIGVTDIDSLIQDYDRDGIQIVAVIQDYIEKLKPKFQYGELRHSLGSVATEMAELAKKYQIPFISAAQLNRTASAVVTDAIANNKTNTTKLLGKQNVSESWDMMKNTDVCIIINREVDDTQENKPQYMGFKLEKFRGKPNKYGVYMFLHPFDENNTITLIPDIDGKPLSKLSIEEFNPLNAKNAKPQIKTISAEDQSSESFLDYCSSLGEDYEDSSESYINICSVADNVVESRRNRDIKKEIKALEEKEKQLIRQRLNERKKICKDDIVRDNCIVILSGSNRYIRIKSRLCET